MRDPTGCGERCPPPRRPVQRRVLPDPSVPPPPPSIPPPGAAPGTPPSPPRHRPTTPPSEPCRRGSTSLPRRSASDIAADAVAARANAPSLLSPNFSRLPRAADSAVRFGPVADAVRSICAASGKPASAQWTEVIARVVTARCAADNLANIALSTVTAIVELVDFPTCVCVMGMRAKCISRARPRRLVRAVPRLRRVWNVAQNIFIGKPSWGVSDKPTTSGGK